MTTEDYIIQISSPEDTVLKELVRETNLKVPAPRMLSGFLQGKLIEFISQMIQPEKILEIGTYTAYSAICWAKGLTDKGVLHTIEINDERENIIRTYLKKAGIESKVRLHIGDASNIIKGLKDVFDIVFIDADKPNYLKYYKMIIDKVKKGGFIIADNVLWDGKVIDTDIKDESTEGIRIFNEYVSNDDRVEKLLLPVRDGLLFIRKK